MKPEEKTIKNALDTASQLHRSILQFPRLLLPDGAKGLGMSKLGVMGYLYREGTKTATELAAYLRIQPQSLTRLIADLEKRSWIRRHPNDADHRQNLLEITEEGARILIRDVMEQRLALAQAIVDALTPSEQEMLRLSAGLIDRLAQAIKTRAPLSKTVKAKKQK
ncbi:MAG: MarR family transcriptional regulator [Rhodocyclaceae bacterium]|nr:MarR family transcriptional regulator [Rhodocyclaceae bacterium]